MSESPQFQRTGKAITQALIDLLHTKPFEKITVQDILDKTPVTRATFYAHFHDKYEIVEKMMDHFFADLSLIRNKLRDARQPWAQAELQTFFLAHRELTQALLKIHTEKVDFRSAMASELEKEYLESSTSATREIEAKIFAQAYVELYISLMNSDAPNPPTEYAYSIFIPVAARLLNLEHDKETLDFLSGRVRKNPFSPK